MLKIQRLTITWTAMYYEYPEIRSEVNKSCNDGSNSKEGCHSINTSSGVNNLNIPDSQDERPISWRRRPDPSIERNLKNSPPNLDTDTEQEDKLIDSSKQDRPSIESEKNDNTARFRNSNSGDAKSNSDATKLDKAGQLRSFESFDRKEEEKVSKMNETGGNIDNSKFIKESSPKDPKKVTLNEKIIKEREELIKFVKNYIKKNNELPPTTLDYYEFVKWIGKGAFGKVTLGIHKLTGKYVAIKTIDKALMKDEFSKRKVFQEVYILKKIRHSNIIRLLEVFESNKHYLMVMEFAGGGDLLHFIKRRGRMQESDAKFIFKQIVYGLSHIHWRSVIHRDIKLDNILLDCESGVKICDFGVSKIIK